MKNVAFGFKKCESCHAVWKVEEDGSIVFQPQSMANHRICRQCLDEVLKESEDIPKKAKPRKPRSKQV